MLIGNKFNILSLSLVSNYNLEVQIAIVAQIVDPLVHKFTYFIITS